MKREERIIRASWLAIVVNALLAFLKLLAGFLSGSYRLLPGGTDSRQDHRQASEH
jgi:divalent metal cation (Fe/Co/Zn/Cd) transporter